MTLAAALAAVAITGAIQMISFNHAQERINELRAVVRTDTDCAMLDNAQLALDMGKPAAAHKALEHLVNHMEKNR